MYIPYQDACAYKNFKYEWKMKRRTIDGCGGVLGCVCVCLFVCVCVCGVYGCVQSAFSPLYRIQGVSKPLPGEPFFMYEQIGQELWVIL